jgi:hypothetical protein
MNRTSKNLPNSTILSHSNDLPAYSNPHLFESNKWIELLRGEYKIDFFLIRQKNGKSFFYFAHLTYPNFEKIVSLPFCDYHIPELKNAEVLNELIGDLKKAFPDAKIQFKWVLPKNVTVDDVQYKISQSAYLHTVYTPDYKKVWDKMDSSFRGKVRQAKRYNLETEFCQDLDSVKEFYESYHQLRIQKFSKIPQSFPFFQNLWQHFIKNNAGFVLKINLDGQSIAFAICLEYKAKIYFKFSCSKKEYLDYRPNNLLLNKLFRYACKENFKAVDLGLSGIGKTYEGLVKFKESMGGIPSPIISLEIIPDSYNLHTEKKLNDLTTEITEKIVTNNPPPAVTSDLSKALYPYFA